MREYATMYVQPHSLLIQEILFHKHKVQLLLLLNDASANIYAQFIYIT